MKERKQLSMVVRVLRRVAQIELSLWGEIAEQVATLQGILDRLAEPEAPAPKRGFKGELERKPEAYKASAAPSTGPSTHPVYPACASLLTGNADNPVPADCSECQGDPECCQRNGGVA